MFLLNRAYLIPIIFVALGIILAAFLLILRHRVRKITAKYLKSEEDIKVKNVQIKHILTSGKILPFIWNVKTDLITALFPEAKAFLLGDDDTPPQGRTLKSMTDRIHPDDRKLLIEEISKIKNGGSTIFILRFDPDGNGYHYLNIRLFFDSTSSNTPDTVFGFLTDITKKKLAQIALEKNEAFINSILNAIPFPVFVVDRNNRFKYWNKQSELLYGCVLSDSVDFLQKEDADKIINCNNKIFKTGKAYSGREDFVTFDGKAHQTIVQKSLIYIGDESYILGVRWNVDEMTQLQELLTISKKHNEIILQNINSGLIYFLPDFTVQWENVSKFSSDPLFEKIRKKGICDSDPSDYNYNTVYTILSDTFQTKKTNKLEITCEDETILELTFIPILNDNDEIDGTILKADDVTENKHLFTQLEDAKERAENADKLKSAFLANMSHEIRTPLNAIIGFSALLKDAQSIEEKEEFSTIINTSSENLLRLINDILDISKIEAGFLKLTNTNFDLAKLFNVLETTFTPRMREGVRLICENPYHSCMVNTDKNRLTQIITNFVTNSIKFTPSGSITFGYELVKNGFKIYVKDTGIGIKKERQERVFGRFEKLNEVAQGTGLGLSICKTIAEHAGGSIGFTSKENVGSTFWAIIPTTTRTTNKME